MQKLSAKEAELQKVQDTEGVKNLIEVESRFLSEHLKPWVPDFCEKVINQANQSFYREMARITIEFLELECEISDSQKEKAC